jgi:environmental stress-induced protein Ves
MLVASRWSGGTTTQFDLYPDHASYTARDFIYRVSSATIEEDPSTFTALPDYQRWIAMLSAPVKLEHEAGETVTLEPREVYTFDGGRMTRSFGCGKDFNLMVRKGVFGWMHLIENEGRHEPVTPGNVIKARALEVSSWLKSRDQSAIGHLLFYCASQALDPTDSTVKPLVIQTEGVLLSLCGGDYARLEGTVNELGRTQIMISPGVSVMLMYIETN